MLEIGSILLFLCLLAFGILFIYFGIDDRNPIFFVLGIAFFATVFILIGMHEVLI